MLPHRRMWVADDKSIATSSKLQTTQESQPICGENWHLFTGRAALLSLHSGQGDRSMWTPGLWGMKNHMNGATSKWSLRSKAVPPQRNRLAPQTTEIFKLGKITFRPGQTNIVLQTTLFNANKKADILTD